MNLASGLNLMMTSQCHNKRLSLCFVCLGANILLFENDNQHVILMSTLGSPTKQINQTFVLETIFFSKIPIFLIFEFSKLLSVSASWNLKCILSIVVSNDFSTEAKHLTLASGLNLMMTSSCPNEAVSLFCVPRANKLHFENEIRYVVFLKYSKLISKK